MVNSYKSRKTYAKRSRGVAWVEKDSPTIGAGGQSFVPHNSGNKSPPNLSNLLPAF